MKGSERQPRMPRTPESEGRTANSPARRQRAKIGVHRLKLHAEGIPAGYHAHWVNDDPGRIEQLMDRGYKFLGRDGVVVGEDVQDGNKAIDTRVSRVVGVTPQGTPKVSYLMVIPEEFYQEDMDLQREEDENLYREIREGQTARKAGDGRYVPDGGIKIKSGSSYKP